MSQRRIRAVGPDSTEFIRGGLNHDIIIRNGTVVDGTGAPARAADVGISGDRIVEIADAVDGGISTSADREIDAARDDDEGQSDPEDRIDGRLLHDVQQSGNVVEYKLLSLRQLLS